MSRGDGLAIIVGAYQSELTIGATLASLAAQTVRPEVVVVVDDASTDRTAEIAAEWEDALPLKLLRHPKNQGHVAAIRTALAAFPTPRFAVFDADDIAFPDHLEVLLAVRARHGGVVSPDALLWWPGSERAFGHWAADHPEVARIDREVAAVLDELVTVTAEVEVPAPA